MGSVLSEKGVNNIEDANQSIAPICDFDVGRMHSARFLCWNQGSTHDHCDMAILLHERAY
jgi:hypothetical protein